MRHYKELSLTARASIWFVFSNAVLKAITFLMAPFFSKLLSVEQYGIATVYGAYQQILCIFATMELSLGAYNRGYLKYNNSRELFTISNMILSNCITLITFGVVVCFRGLFYAHTQMGLRVLLLSYMLFLVQPAYNCWLVRKRYDYSYKSVVGVTLIYAVLQFCIPLFAVKYIKADAETKVFFSLLVALVFCFPFYFSSFKNIKNDFSIKKMLEMCRFCFAFQLPLVVHSLSFLVLGQSDRMMIKLMVNAEAAGIYSVGYMIATIMSICQVAFGQAYQPLRYTCLRDKKYGEIKKTSTNQIVVFVSLLLLMMIIAPDIVRFLFPKDYMDAIWVISPVSVGVFFMFLYSLFVDIESYFGQTKYIMVASVMCAALNILLNYLLLPIFGYLVCGYTTMVSYSALALMHYYFMKKTCSKYAIKVEIFDKKTIVFATIFVLLFSFILLGLYSFNQVRYAALAIGVVICYVKRNAIGETLESMMKERK